jgi:hypothetical protein
MESFLANVARQNCSGVILTLKSNRPTIPKHIIAITPCRHGLNHPEADGDYLKYTCRKMQVMIQHQAATNYYETLP